MQFCHNYIGNSYTINNVPDRQTDRLTWLYIEQIGEANNTTSRLARLAELLQLSTVIKQMITDKGGNSKKCYFKKYFFDPLTPWEREKMDPLEIKSKISYLGKKTASYFNNS